MKARGLVRVWLLGAVAACGFAAGPEEGLAVWSKANLWFGDSIVWIAAERTAEVQRDMTDLWGGCRQMAKPGLLADVVQFHAFQWLAGETCRRLFSEFPDVQKVRFVLSYRKSGVPVVAGKFHLSRAACFGEQFKGLAGTTDARAYARLAGEALDAVWINDAVRKE